MVPRVRRVLGVGGLAALLMSGEAAMQAPAIEDDAGSARID